MLVHLVPCVLCKHLGLKQESRTEAHHMKEGAGLSQRSQHTLVLALCWEHHHGPSGVEGLGTKGLYTRYKLDEIDLLAMTIEAVVEELHKQGPLLQWTHYYSARR
jgi:hypothetical protein